MSRLDGRAVRVRVARIRAKKEDHEAAHGLEDALYLDVLAAIANGEVSDPRAVAREALKASRIRFVRWRA